jgi:HSP20 family protein
LADSNCEDGERRRQVDRMFDDFFNDFGIGGRSLRPLTGGWHGVAPTVDVTEGEKEVVVTAGLPGLDRNDFEVALSGDVLAIKGEKKAQQEKRTAIIITWNAGSGLSRAQCVFPSR